MRRLLPLGLLGLSFWLARNIPPPDVSPLPARTALAHYVFSGFTKAAGGGGITLVNRGFGQDNTGSSVGSIATGAMNVTGGNLLACWATLAGNFFSSVTDTAGNTFTQVTAVSEGGFNGSWYYAKNVTGNASDVVTFTLSSSRPFPSIQCLQFSGLNTTTPLDVSNASATSATSVSSLTTGTFSTAAANEVILLGAALDSTSETYSPGAIGGTTALLDGNSTGTSGAEYRIVSATQTNITAAISWNSATDGLIQTVSFKQ